MKILYVFFFMDIMNISIFLTVFTKQVITLGGSNLHLGLIGSSAALLGLILKSVAGHLSDTRGTTNVLPWCFSISALGNIVSAFSPSLPVLFAGRLLCAFGSPVQALLNTVITTLKKEDQSVFVNKLGICIASGMIFGSLIGGFISEFGNGITYPYLLISSNLLTSFALVRALPKNSPKEKTNEQKPTSGALAEVKSTMTNLKNVFLSETYWDVLAMKGCLEVMNGLSYANLIYTMAIVRGMGGKQIGYVIIGLCTCGIVTNLIQMKVNAIFYSEDKGYSKIMHGSLLFVVGYLGITLASSFSSFISFFMLCSIGNTLMDPGIMKLLLFKVNENEKGTVMSSFDSIRSLVELVNPIVSGTIVEVFGPKGVYPVCMCLTAVTIAISIVRKDKV